VKERLLIVMFGNESNANREGSSSPVIMTEPLIGSISSSTKYHESNRTKYAKGTHAAGSTSYPQKQKYATALELKKVTNDWWCRFIVP